MATGMQAAMSMERRLGHVLLALLVFIFQISPSLVWANPSGGQSIAGTISIESSGNTLTITQGSSRAIINWQSFSSVSGELTKFIQPDANSAILNRVVSGNLSSIYGNLQANGQVYLINPNGILIGSSGVINAGSFIASTHDISNAQFMSGGTLRFVGTSDASIVNQGRINAIGGNVYLIAANVRNEGTIHAPQGTVGLAGGHDVLIQQEGDEHLFVATGSSGTVSNLGTIHAVQAELKAVGGNVYALAVNNEGIIRATGVANRDGKILLIGQSGILRNTGTLSARNSSGTGGWIETSGKHLALTGGVVDAGMGGLWVIDPSDFIIDSSMASTINTALNGGSNILAQNVDGSLTVDSPLTWTTTASLTLSASTNLFINALIEAPIGTLQLSAADTSASITTGLNGVIQVDNFKLLQGRWYQAASILPGFSASHNFSIVPGAQFLRASGGEGTAINPYLLFDVYGLQGMAYAPMSNSYKLIAHIDASSTQHWNSGKGFATVGSGSVSYTGTFDGNNMTIDRLSILRPSEEFVALFGTNEGTIKNLTVSNVQISGGIETAAIAGRNYMGTISGVSVTGTITGSGAITGAIAAENLSSIENCRNQATIRGQTYSGGIAGRNAGSNATIGNSTNSGVVDATMIVGGIVGQNYQGTVTNSNNNGTVSGTVSHIGGIVGSNENYAVASNNLNTGTVTGPTYVGGIAGHNSLATVSSSTNTGKIKATAYYAYLGGIVGNNYYAVIDKSLNTGTISSANSNAYYIGGIAGGNRYYSQITNSENRANISGGTSIGGIAGLSDASTYQNVINTGTITGSYHVGGLVGSDANGSIVNGYNSGTVTANGTGGNVGGLIGMAQISYSITSSSNTGTISGVYNVGGLAGSFSNGSINQSTNSGTVTATNTASGGIVGNLTNGTLNNVLNTATISGKSIVGGLAGYINGPTITNSTNSGTVIASNSYAGGIVGMNSSTSMRNATLSHCLNTGIISAGDYFAGGLVGYSSYGNLLDSTNQGAVTAIHIAGGIVGRAERSTLDRVQNTASISSEISTGGLAAELSYSTLRNSSNSGKVSSGNTGGGLVGNMASSTLSRSINSGDVVAISTTRISAESVGTVMGGLVGYVNSSDIISESANTGSVTGVGYVGGLAGFNLGKIENSYTTGSVSGTNRTGGFAGFNQGYITKCYASGKLTGNSDSVRREVGLNYGALSGVVSDSGTGDISPALRNVNTYLLAGFDFTSIWAQNIDTVANTGRNGGYAYLQWQTLPVESLSSYSLPLPYSPGLTLGSITIVSQTTMSNQFISSFDNFQRSIILLNQLISAHYSGIGGQMIRLPSRTQYHFHGALAVGSSETN